MLITDIIKSNKMLNNFKKINKGEIWFHRIKGNNYIIETNLCFDDIVFPKNMEHRIRLYDNSNDSLQLEIARKNVKFAVLNCRMAHEMIERNNKTREENKRREQIIKEQERIKAEKEKQIRIEKAKEYEKVVQLKYERYKKYVIETGGNSKLFDLEIVEQLIKTIIRDGDPRLITEGKSTIYYKDANEDGTFDICGRMLGPNVSVVYKMEYCNDNNPEHFIKLSKYQKEHKPIYSIDFPIEDNHDKKVMNENILFVNKEGNVVEEIKKSYDTDYSSSLLEDLNKSGKVKKLV